MKTLQECKDEVAMRLGRKDWHDFFTTRTSNGVSAYAPLEEAAKLYAEYALREAAEKATVEEDPKDYFKMPEFRNYQVDKDSILSIIKELK